MAALNTITSTFLEPTHVEINNVAAVADALVASEHGLVVLTGLDAAPIGEIQALHDRLRESEEIGERLNSAYPKNLVYKNKARDYDPALGEVDQKAVLDLSPDRILAINTAEPALIAEAGPALESTLSFWERLRTDVVPVVAEAVGMAIGNDEILKDCHANYRMVDYFPRFETAAGPRCGEHRDFGSFTLIMTNEQAGLEVFVGGEWRPVAPQPADAAILLCGWCTCIRSNGRVAAPLHRVSNHATAEDGLVPRRTSAVLFVAPKDVSTPLEPVVMEGETRQFISGIKVGQLRGDIARKWRHREGTLNAEDKLLEEREIRVEQLVTQDDVVQSTIQVQGS